MFLRDLSAVYSGVGITGLIHKARLYGILGLSPRLAAGRAGVGSPLDAVVETEDQPKGMTVMTWSRSSEPRRLSPRLAALLLALAALLAVLLAGPCRGRLRPTRSRWLTSTGAACRWRRWPCSRPAGRRRSIRRPIPVGVRTARWSRAASTWAPVRRSCG